MGYLILTPNRSQNGPKLVINPGCTAFASNQEISQLRKTIPKCRPPYAFLKSSTSLKIPSPRLLKTTRYKFCQKKYYYCSVGETINRTHELIIVGTRTTYSYPATSRHLLRALNCAAQSITGIR